jgi:phage FluMu protein Com
MEDVTCQRCQTTNEFYIEESGPHLKAMCNHCNRYIKFVSKEEPKLYVGKYKGVPIKDIEDMGYLKWALTTLKINATVITAIQNRISSFEHLAK